ncbi:ABC transporter ATP-binding protein [Actinomadura barringtoniae]|uniref:ABC transporter ATP-binding protein n=1 Tax=Actinomadura barringtoniae TaxID=1427535 RepID=A0A939T3C8_9ACTN|nr:ABC transporter ATP-binding protein [Actinomadura barringtoniae]MBO2446454.1 ABC transporter ATP-binding protein [Actinomadura barringtoniae]
MTDVVLDGVNKVYPGDQHAVRDLGLRIRDGELFVLLGPSGCGKSTVLRMIAGLEEITSGDLWLGGTMANELPPRERNVAMVFQNGALYPHRSVRGNMMFPLEVSKDDPAGARGKVVELARALGLDSMLDRLPGTLSGGQRQRVAMGRALIREPSVFLMDEPLSSLDAGLRAELRVEIAALVRATGATTVYVTHDQVEAMTMADRIAVLRDGILEDVGTPEQIYHDPATVFVAAFLSSPPINLLRATAWAVQDQGVILELGPHQLRLPWDDPRATGLISHHGRPIIVGLRADALTTVTGPAHGPELTGQVRTLEFHGHEWLAYAEAGIALVDAHDVAPERAAVPAAAHQLGLGDRMRAMLGRPVNDPDPGPEHTGHHRRTDLIFRITTGDRPARGDQVRLSVDLDRLLVFSPDGRRVDPVRR